MKNPWVKLIILLSLGGLIGMSSSFANEKKNKEDDSSEKTEKRKGIVDQISGQGYGTAGCGLGSILFGEKEGMIQLFAYTTNTYAGQTLAISSGTSNCDAGENTQMASVIFIEANKFTLANDVARGSGETLTSLLHLMKCSPAQSVEAQSLLQKNFSHIFPASEVSAAKIHQEIEGIIKADATCAG